jgi:hypothetical protein
MNFNQIIKHRQLNATAIQFRYYSMIFLMELRTLDRPQNLQTANHATVTLNLSHRPKYMPLITTYSIHSHNLKLLHYKITRIYKKSTKTD